MWLVTISVITKQLYGIQVRAPSKSKEEMKNSLVTIFNLYLLLKSFYYNVFTCLKTHSKVTKVHVEFLTFSL